MSLEYDDEALRIIAVWVERFGEPPAIMAEPALMWRVLETSGPQVQAE